MANDMCGNMRELDRSALMSCVRKSFLEANVDKDLHE